MLILLAILGILQITPPFGPSITKLKDTALKDCPLTAECDPCAPNKQVELAPDSHKSATFNTMYMYMCIYNHIVLLYSSHISLCASLFFFNDTCYLAMDWVMNGWEYWHHKYRII